MLVQLAARHCFVTCEVFARHTLSAHFNNVQVEHTLCHSTSVGYHGRVPCQTTCCQASKPAKQHHHCLADQPASQLGRQHPSLTLKLYKRLRPAALSVYPRATADRMQYVLYSYSLGWAALKLRQCKDTTTKHVQACQIQSTVLAQPCQSRRYLAGCASVVDCLGCWSTSFCRSSATVHVHRDLLPVPFAPALPTDSLVQECLCFFRGHAQVSCQLASASPIHYAEVDALAQLPLLRR